jgi:2-polyprenyl-3-methyl-5-hydroxy-6-metoxy-1,4-benzoquinol methylase
MSVQARYRANYDQIARVHIDHWRVHGTNPFQDPALLKENEDATVALIEKYAPHGYWLDVGCGMGDLLMRFPNRERMGVDISSEYLRIAEDRGLLVANRPVEQMKLPAGCFDLVTATDILEHVLDLNKAVTGLLKVLREGGILIVRVPNDEPLSTNTDPYEFVHLRRFDYSALYILFHKIFDVEVLDIPAAGNSLHAVVRK